jgi:hypothetical protein
MWILRKKFNAFKAIMSWTTKNCEGYDQISQRVLLNELEYSQKPLSVLFKIIYKPRMSPEQWLIAKFSLSSKWGILLKLKFTDLLQTCVEQLKNFENLFL